MTRAKYILLASLLALQTGDWLTTRYLLQHGAVEANGLVLHLGVMPAKLLACLLAVALLWRARKLWHVWTVTALYAVVVAWNLTMVAIAK